MNYINKVVQLKDHGLANHLLLILKILWHIEGRKLDSFKVLNNIENLDLVKKINKGFYRKIYESKRIGLSSAKKIIDFEFNAMFIQEIGHLISKSHLNLIKYYCVVKNNKNENRESSIINNSI